MSSYSENNSLSEYTVIGNLTIEEKAELLRELGDTATADELLASLPAEETKSIFSKGRFSLMRKPQAWEHTSHSFGFLPANSATDAPQPIHNANQIAPDLTLRNGAVTIRLDKLRVADYPGQGIHRNLFDF